MQGRRAVLEKPCALRATRECCALHESDMRCGRLARGVDDSEEARADGRQPYKTHTRTAKTSGFETSRTIQESGAIVTRLT
eukprot:1800147-Pleurochrysis_carterae.AAC.1